jgi:hypothetical protein
MQHGEGHLSFALIFSEVYHAMLCQWPVEVIKNISQQKNNFQAS